MSNSPQHIAPKHIALVSNTSWSLYNFRLGLIRAFLDQGIQVYAIAPRDDYSDKLTAAGATYIPIALDAYATSVKEGLRDITQFYKLYKAHKFDIVIHYTIKANIYGSIAAKLAGCRSIAVVTGLGRTFQFKGMSQSILKLMYRVGLKCSSQVWFLNKEDRQKFLAESFTRIDKTFILPSEGVNTRKFNAAPKETQHNGVVRFLFAGRLLKDKGILEYVEAARVLTKTHQKIKFEVVGFVNPNNQMSVTLDNVEQWQKEGVINYLGSHEDIRPYILRSDCIVFPSYYQEGVSRILLEAASMSRPIITTNNVGCRDVVEDKENGLLVEPRSVEEVIRAIEEFLCMDMEARRAMGINGRRSVKARFDERIIIDQYFHKLLGSRTTFDNSAERIVHGIDH